MKPEYRLVYHGHNEQSLQSQSVLIDLLNDHYGLSQSGEIGELIANPPFVIKRASSREELESDLTTLRRAGAEMMIVRATQNASTLSQQILKEHVHSQSSTNNQPIVTKQSSTGNFDSFFLSYSNKLHQILLSLDVSQVEHLAKQLIDARGRDSQIFILGNGGSAAAASHLATDLAKERFADPRSLFRVLSLTDNVPWMSATANDFGYEKVFLQQLKNLLRPKDLVIAISSSGNSANVLRAVEYANQNGAQTYGIVGFDGGALGKTAQHSVHIPTKNGQYGYMEDVSSILGHMLSIYIYEQDNIVWGNK